MEFVAGIGALSKSVCVFFVVHVYIYHVFGKIILVIFDHSKWFENSLENGLKNDLENGLTLQILRWYKWLRFKDIV